jgi:hypothetical protein
MPPKRIAVRRTRLLPSTKATLGAHARQAGTRRQFQIDQR